jgi:hypothetical protein
MNMSNHKFRAAIGGVACLLMVMTALLLWGRLKLVTGVPRTAYAEPENQHVDAAAELKTREP